MRVLISGYGYIGSALAGMLVEQGHEVVVVVRTPKPEVDSAGLRVVVADITDASQVSRVGRGYDWVVNCTAAGGDGGETEYRSIYVGGNANLLQWFGTSPVPAKYVYTSSTSVYGQDDGSVVNETSPANPAPPTGRILVEAENLVLRAGRQGDVPGVVLRLAGIYGPGRGYWFKQFLNGQAVMEGSGDRVLNMVHREDVAGAIVAALHRARPAEVYNVVDDEPVTQRALFQWLASTLGRPLPPQVETTETVRKRGATNKRVSNRKLKTELGYQFQFPTFREGYASEIRRLAPDGTTSTNAE